MLDIICGSKTARQSRFFDKKSSVSEKSSDLDEICYTGVFGHPVTMEVLFLICDVILARNWLHLAKLNQMSLI